MLIVAEDDLKQVEKLFKPLSEQFKEVTSWVWMHNPKLNNSYADLDYQMWRGEAYITETLGGFSFQISPTSFFQTNPKQAETLYGVVKQWLGDVLPEGAEKHKLVYDLYSGTGSIGIYVSELAEKIVGIEYVDSSIEDASEDDASSAVAIQPDKKNEPGPEMIELSPPEKPAAIRCHTREDQRVRSLRNKDLPCQSKSAISDRFALFWSRLTYDTFCNNRHPDARGSLAFQC